VEFPREEEVSGRVGEAAVEFVAGHGGEIRCVRGVAVVDEDVDAAGAEEGVGEAVFDRGLVEVVEGDAEMGLASVRGEGGGGTSPIRASRRRR
jgi:hypothetical protein